jgi:hypothetical protein
MRSRNLCFNLPNLYRHTVTLGLTQSLTEGVPENVLWVKRGRRIRLTTSLSSMSRLSGGCESVYIKQPHGPPRSVIEIALLYGDGVCFL